MIAGKLLAEATSATKTWIGGDGLVPERSPGQKGGFLRSIQKGGFFPKPFGRTSANAVSVAVE